MFCSKFYNVLSNSISRNLAASNISNVMICKFKIYKIYLSCKGINTSSLLYESSKSIERIVSPLCAIKVRSSCCNVKIKPTNPDDFKNSDRFLAQLNAPDDSSVVFDVVQSEVNKLTLDIKNNTSKNLPEFFLQVPVQSSIEVLGSEASSVHIQDIQSDKLLVTCDSGSINTKNIRASQLELSTTEGNINCGGVLQGNIKLSTSKNGVIKCQRLQGRMVQLNTDSGDIKLASCYSDTSQVSTNAGNVTLESLHRTCDILIQGKGNLTVSGFDGCITARLNGGTADIQISKLQSDSFVESNSGDVKLRLTDSTDCQLNLEASNIKIPNTFSTNKQDYIKEKNMNVTNFVNGSNTEASVLKVICKNGTIELIKASWISTLNLNKKSST